MQRTQVLWKKGTALTYHTGCLPRASHSLSRSSLRARASRASRASRANRLFRASDGVHVVVAPTYAIPSLWYLTIRGVREIPRVCLALATYALYVSFCMADTSRVQLTPIVRIARVARGSLAGVTIHAARGNRSA